MTDVTKMSTAELLAIVNGGAAPQRQSGGLLGVRPQPIGRGPMKLDEADAKRLADESANAQQKRMIADRAKEFMGYNRKQDTGGYRGVQVLPGWLGGASIGDIQRPWNDKLSIMDSITSEVAPQMRPTGAGSSSDKDIGMFKRSFPNIETPRAANEAMTYRRDTDASKAQARADWMQSWAEKRGNLRGADTEFNRWWVDKTAQKRQERLAGKPQSSGGKSPIMTIDIDGNPIR